ncbi:MAG: hypothetical protein KY447_03895 [Actinobacteria bacterium]|nr:hypothetical protein [Actinomycetota bacterium]MBW3642035.1 hypothetical protein [Actinomycetota bacterium]
MTNTDVPQHKTSDRQQVIRDLEVQLQQTPKALRPHEHAVVAYRLGLAHAEAPTANPEASLRKALSYFDVASAIFDPRFDPVEHARVLNGAGSVRRTLGERPRAAELFQTAADLLEGQDRDDERAGVLNNLGLVRAELGQLDRAVQACDEAVELFDTTTAEGRRGLVAALHTRGMAHAAAGTDEGLEAALVDYRRAASELDVEEAPYHHGLVQHSIGVTFTTLAGRRPDDRHRLLGEAVSAFVQSLAVFTRSAFPFQYALVKNNLGLAWAGMGGMVNLRRALTEFEYAVGVFDPRLHGDAWREAYANLERTEKELAARGGGSWRAAHFVALLAAVDDEERRALVRERLVTVMAQPGEQRRRALLDLASAGAHLEPDDARTVMEAELSVLIELPTDQLEPGLRARLEAHRQIDDVQRREDADRAFDQAISDALQGPQRVSVRDFLYSLDWERP